MAPETPISNTIVVESKPSAIVEVCRAILPALEGNSYDQEDVFAVHLAMEEAFTNAIKHGNKMDATKSVKIEYSIDPDKIEISISDQGNGFNPQDIPDPRQKENLYKIEGRGLFLMRSYMDVVRYNERGNNVHMIRYKEKPSIMKRKNQIQT